VIRGKARALATGDLVLAARVIGASPARIITRHLAPNVARLTAAMASLLFAQNLLAEAALGYLGLGPQPPAASWGRMLYDARAYYRTAPWLLAGPGGALLVAVIAFQLIGDGLAERPR
jgi:peptide/nickel transport system permease protein